MNLFFCKNGWRPKTALILAFAMGILLNTSGQTNPSPTYILKLAELERIPWARMSFRAILEDSSQGSPSHSTYQVFADSNRAIVKFLEPAKEKGKILLIRGDDLWLYFPTASQPLKITPLQRLSGAVSFVDIARLNWSLDFQVDSMTKVQEPFSTKASYLFFLRARNPSTSYRRVQLWVSQSDHHPLRADIYLGSAKPYKTMVFASFSKWKGKEVNTKMISIDHFNGEKQTTLQLSDFSPENTYPAGFFEKDNLKNFPR